MVLVKTVVRGGHTQPHALLPLGLLASLLLGLGCSTALYDGPERSSRKIASLTAARGTNLVSVDRRPVRGGKFEVYDILPGRHQVVAEVKESNSLAPHLQTLNDMRTPFCFDAEAAESYSVAVSVDGEELRQAILDRDSGEDVRTDCASEPAQARSATAARVAESPERPPAHVERPRSRFRAAEEDEPEDGESPVRGPIAPIMGARLGFGFGFGGDDLIKATYTNGDTQSLSAGSGVVFSLGAVATPLWVGDAAGFGVGGSIGVKYDSMSASNGNISFVRVPADLWLQTLLRVSPHWFFTVAGGMHKDLDATLSGSGLAADINYSFDRPWGWMAELGFLNMTSRNLGYTFAFRFTNAKYLYESAPINAQSFGLELSLFAGS
jgi:hypothetical protein